MEFLGGLTTSITKWRWGASWLYQWPVTQRCNMMEIFVSFGWPIQGTACQAIRNIGFWVRFELGEKNNWRRWSLNPTNTQVRTFTLPTSSHLFLSHLLLFPNSGENVTCTRHSYEPSQRIRLAMFTLVFLLCSFSQSLICEPLSWWWSTTIMFSLLQ